MPYCTKCGQKNEDRSRFCSECGAPLVAQATPRGQASPTSPTPPPKPKSSGTVVAVTIACVLAVVVTALMLTIVLPAITGGTTGDSGVTPISSTTSGGNYTTQSASESSSSYTESPSIPANPTSIDVSGPKMGKTTTLYGTIERENYTAAQVGMNWGAAVYYLRLESPVTITFNGMTGEATTMDFDRIQVRIHPKYLDEDEHLANFPEDIQTEDDRYVGMAVAVTGPIINAGTAYYMGGGAFFDATIRVL